MSMKKSYIAVLGTQVSWELGDSNWKEGGGISAIGWELGYEPNVAGEDLDAINEYMMRTPAVVPQSVALKDAWVKWWNDLSWWDIVAHNQNTYDIARNKRNQFNLTNVESPEEKTQVEDTIKQGLTSEQLDGKADRRLSDGSFPEQPIPPVSLPIKIAIGITAAVAVVAAAYATPKAVLERHIP